MIVRMWLLTTQACTECGKVSDIEVTDAEYNALRHYAEGEFPGLRVKDILPDRDDAFAFLVATGMHDKCWKKKMRDLSKTRDANSIFKK